MHCNRYAEAGCRLGVLCAAVIVMNIAAGFGVSCFVFGSGPIIFPRHLHPAEVAVAVIVIPGRFVGLVLAMASWHLSLLGFDWASERRTRRGRTEAAVGLACSTLYCLYALFVPIEVSLSTGF